MKKEIKKYKWYFGMMLITMLVAIAVEEKNNMDPEYISYKYGRVYNTGCS